ncbi:MAG TPA: glycosyltransferase family 39 protein, partial [Mycobacteriales bacterium]|nr:glycosyltransferase family 39 protein [Mycobacteriales bacterium]
MTTSTLSRGQVVADPSTERTVRVAPWRLAMRHAYWWLPTLLAAVLVPYQAWRPVLDWDEPATWDASTRSVSELFALAGHIDGVLLPYYLFMHYWVQAFGDSELMLRAPSILAVIATVPIVASLARRLFDSRVALLAALLFAGLPTVSRYGQEARPYGLALMFAAAATLLLVWALETPSRSRWVAYGVAVALLGLTQLLALLLLIAHGVAVGYRWWRAPRFPDEVSHRRTAIRWGTAVGAAVVPSIPLVVLGFLQRGSQLSWLPGTSWATLRSFPNEVVWAPALGWFLIGISLLAKHRYRDRVRYLAVMAVVPAAVLYLLGLFTALWMPRYVMFSVIAWCILAAVAVAGSWLRIGMMLVIVTILVVPAQQTIRRPGAVGYGIVDGSNATASYQVGDHRAAMQIVAENYRPGDGIVFEPESAWSLR